MVLYASLVDVGTSVATYADVRISYAVLVEVESPSAEVGTPYASLGEVVMSLVEVGTHACWISGCRDSVCHII